MIVVRDYDKELLTIDPSVQRSGTGLGIACVLQEVTKGLTEGRVSDNENPMPNHHEDADLCLIVRTGDPTLWEKSVAKMSQETYCQATAFL